MEALETFMGVSRGQNGLLDPDLLKDGYASRLYNVTVRNGVAQTRPGLTGATCPVQGRFQGAFEYRLEDKDYWVVVVAGQVWVFQPSEDEWTYITTFPTTDFAQAYFVQADKYAIIQNGIYAPTENWPIILHDKTVIDNLAVQYLSGNDVVTLGDLPQAEWYRVPIGTSMAYGHGRLFVTVDRYYNDGASGDPDTGWKNNIGSRFWMASNIFEIDNQQAMLSFSDSFVVANGLAFGLPSEMGFITSMAFLRNAETGTGLGALVVFARRGASAFAVNISRERSGWLSQGFGQVLFMSSGSNSPWAVTGVNSDLVYYGNDGLRTLKYSASMEAGTSGLASVPVSPEVYNFTRLTDHKLHSPSVTLAHVDNYLFFTASGVTLDDGSVAFEGILPWDLATFQVSGGEPARVFAGGWCGQLVHAVLAYRADTDTVGAIYRESQSGDLKYGFFTPGVADAAVSSVHTPAYAFGNSLMRKKVKPIDVMFDRVSGDVYVWVRWRFEDTGEWNYSSVRHLSGTGGSSGFLKIPVASDNFAGGFAVQYAIEWKGSARLRAAVFRADTHTPAVQSATCDTITVAGTADDVYDFGCPTDRSGV